MTNVITPPVDKNQTTAADLNAEAKENGFKPVFEDDEKPAIPPKAEDKEEGELDMTDDKKTTVTPEDNNRQSRAPLRETRERIRQGLEVKFEEKYGKEITSLKDTIEKMKKGDLSNTEISDLKGDIKALAKELNIDETHLEKITLLSRKGIDDELTTLKGKLSKYEQLEQAKEEDITLQEQEEIFNDEWNDVAPSLKEKFPNASREQLEKAQIHMDELAHSDKYHEYDLDYILFKESKEFEKILFSPKKKGFESTSTPEGDLESEEDDLFTNPKTPQTMNDLLKLERKTKKFEEGLPDTRFTVK